MLPSHFVEAGSQRRLGTSDLKGHVAIALISSWEPKALGNHRSEGSWHCAQVGSQRQPGNHRLKRERERERERERGERKREMRVEIRLCKVGEEWTGGRTPLLVLDGLVEENERIGVRRLLSLL